MSMRLPLSRDFHHLSRWALVWLFSLAATLGWAGVPPVAGLGAGRTPSLADALNPDGTLRAGVSGSFDPKGYRLLTAPDGKPVFRPMGVAGAGDENWQDGFGINGVNGTVRALAVDGSGNVYAGGGFTTAGGVAANNIAKWNGSNWSSLGTGMNNAVYALAVDGSGNVYAGGIFSTTGGVAANGIAKWNGSSWSALGMGVDNYAKLKAPAFRPGMGKMNNS